MRKLRSITIVALATVLFILTLSFNAKASALTNNELKNVDVNYDSVIDIKDIALVASKYNLNSSMNNWNSSYDINSDHLVDIFDLVLTSKSIGLTMSFKDYSLTIGQYDPFDLPNSYKIFLNDGSYVSTPITWNTTRVNTDSCGRYTYTGKLSNYNKLITLTIDVVKSNENPINHGNIINSGIVTKQGMWTYYLNTANEGKLSRVNEDGSIVKKISDDVPFYINVLNGWIYYSNASDNLSIYKIKTDGTGRVKLNNNVSEFINVVGEWIYYQNNSDDYKLYKMKLDGSENTKINDERSLYINVKDEWIYYSNFSNYGEVCKVRTDGTGKVAINDELSYNTIIDGEWIYYSNGEDNECIYRMKLDGSNRTKITNFSVRSFNVSGEWIFYSNGGEYERPFKIKIDGTQSIRLDASSSGSSFNLIDGKVYYINNNDSSLYEIKTDGSGKRLFGLDTVIDNIEEASGTVMKGDIYEFPASVVATMSDGSKQHLPVLWKKSFIDTSKVGSTTTFTGTVKGYDKSITLRVTVTERANSNSNSVNEAFVAQSGEWIFYKENSDGKLYKIKEDNTGKVKLADDDVSNIHVLGEWVYYISQQRIFKVKIDGTSRTQVVYNKTYWFNMMGDWLFYQNYDDNYSLYKVKIDGSGVTKLNNDSSSSINVANDWVYYVNVNDGSSVYKIKSDGSLRTKVIDNFARKIIVYNGYIYYTNSNDDYKTYRIKTDGTANEKISDDNMDYLNYMNISNDWIYYLNRSDADKLYKIKVDGTQKSKVTNEDLNCGGNRGLNILGNYIYYNNYLDNEKVYRITLDGKDKQPFGTIVNIFKINDIYVNIKTNSQYTLPKTVVAQMSEGLDKEYAVTWNISTVITSKPGVYTYEGTVQGYSNKVKLQLTVSDLVPYGNTLGNGANNALATRSGDWIYYYSNSQTTGKSINKIKADGTGKAKLVTGWSLNEVHVVNDWIYFLEGSVLYKIKIDGTGKTRVMDEYTSEICIVGDWIYYESNGGIYRIKLNGSEKVRIANISAQGIKVYNGWIYYEDGSGLNKIRVDGTEKTNLNMTNNWFYNISENYIYFYDYAKGKIFRSNLDGTGITPIVVAESTRAMNVSGGWIYYHDDYKLYKVKLDGTSKTLVSSDNALEINVVGDWVYYKCYSDEYIYRIKTDGTNRERLN